MVTMMDPRPIVQPEVIAYVGVRCGKVLKKGKRAGETCNHLLCRVDIEQWDDVMTAAIEGKCGGDDCGAVYTLAEYR
jgi:hypothetical protein